MSGGIGRSVRAGAASRGGVGAARAAWWVLFLALFGSACTSSTRLLTEGAPGELRLGYDGGLEVWAGRAKIAASPAWGGLATRVACDPKALELATTAESQGSLARGTSVIGAALGFGSMVALGAAAADHDRSDAWLIGGVTSAVVGLIVAAVTREARVEADGRAVDAVNFYGDALRDPESPCFVGEVAPPRRAPALEVRPDRDPAQVEPAPQPAGEVPNQPGTDGDGEPGRERPVRAPTPK